MVRRKIYQGINKKGALLVLILIVGAAFFVAGGTPFKTFKLGTDYEANIYFSKASFYGEELYERGLTDQPSIVTMDDPEALTMFAEPIPGFLIPLSVRDRMDGGHTSLWFSIGTVRSVGLDGGVSNYDQNTTAEQWVEGGWNINKYKIRFEVLLSTLLESNYYSGLVEDEPLTYAFENEMEVADIARWYRTEEMNNVELKFNIDLEGSSETHHADIIGAGLVQNSIVQEVHLQTYDVGYVPTSYSQNYSAFIKSTAVPTDYPKLPDGGPSVSVATLSTENERTTSLEVTVNWAKVAPGMAYHEAKDLFSIYNVMSMLDIELEVDVYANTYAEAKFSMQDVPFVEVPEFISSYEWIEQNTWLVLIIFVIIIAIPLSAIWFFGRTIEKWVGEGKLEVVI